MRGRYTIWTTLPRNESCRGGISCVLSINVFVSQRWPENSLGEYKLIEVDYSLSGELKISRYLVVRKVISDLIYHQVLKHLCKFWVLIGLIVYQRVFHREYLLQLA